MSEGKDKLGFQATWSMAVGGMVGGGIFSTLGVVIGIAGQWAWLSFLLAGLVALASGYSYSKLTALYHQKNEMNLPEILIHGASQDHLKNLTVSIPNFISAALRSTHSLSQRPSSQRQFLSRMG